MNNKSTLYIIQGFIGAGKSTFSKKLTKETGASILNPDEWVSKLFTKEECEQEWDRCFDNAVAILWEKAKSLLKEGISVIFDMGFWFKKDRDFARKVAEECGAETVLYYLYVPDEILKKRIIDSRPPRWAKIHIENFDKNKEKFEIPLPEENAIKINNF